MATASAIEIQRAQEAQRSADELAHLRKEIKAIGQKLDAVLAAVQPAEGESAAAPKRAKKAE